MDTVSDGNLSNDFGGSYHKKKEIHADYTLIPVIFLHGMTGTRTSYSGFCRDMASHGYIVFSIDHHDGSSSYSIKADGTEIFWSSDQRLEDFNLRVKQLKVR